MNKSKVFPFVHSRVFKKKSHRRKTSTDSFWYFDSEEIKKNFDFDKLKKVCAEYPWGFDQFEEKHLSAKPHTLHTIGSPRLVMPMKPEFLVYDLFTGDDLNSFLFRNSFSVDFNVKLGCELNDASLIIPNPNRLREGRTKDGRLSSCCRDAIGKRRYIVVELNHQMLDERMQASVLSYLSNSFDGRLKMIVKTSNYPPQAWFLADKSEYQNWKFMNEAVELGSNKLFWRPETPARMPNGICRETGELQSCIYYDLEISNLEEVA